MVFRTSEEERELRIKLFPILRKHYDILCIPLEINKSQIILIFDFINKLCFRFYNKMNLKKIKFLSFIAFRYLKSSKKHKYPSAITIISLLGVTISVATLIIVLSVMNGFSFELKSKILGVNAHVTLENYGLKPIENYEKIVKNISNISDVKYINPIVDGQAMVINNKKSISSGAMIKGIALEDLKNRYEIYNNIVLHPDCENTIFDGKNGVILGSVLARSVGVGIGESVSLVTSVGDNTIFGFIPRYRDFFVCGIFESGASIYDSSMILMSIDIAQMLFKYKNSASGIEIFLNDSDNAEKFINLLKENELWDEHISDWQRSNESLFHAMKIERTVMSLIMTLFLCVSMFGIFANMINMVNNKTKNIAIMKSFGMKSKEIAYIFLIAGGSIGVCGTVFGCIIGISFANNIDVIKRFLESLSGATLFDGAIYFLSYLPAKIFISDLIFVITTALVCTIIASIVPAIRAARVNIAETLRQI